MQMMQMKRKKIAQKIIVLFVCKCTRDKIYLSAQLFSLSAAAVAAVANR